MTIELKQLNGGEIDFKSVTDKGVFEGYLAVFNNLDQGKDVILPEAFTKSLGEHKERNTSPKLLWQHSPMSPLGTWKNVRVDSHGVIGEGHLLLDTQKGAETYSMIKAQAVNGISIGYRTLDFDSRLDGGRDLKELDLVEASVVTFPMNTSAVITSVKNVESIRDIERVLRDAGIPNTFAKLVATHGYDEAKALLDNQQRDAEITKETEVKARALLASINAMKGKFNG